MMHWRASNKRKAYRPPPEIEADLGPVIPPMVKHRATIILRKELDPVAAIVTAVCAVSGIILVCVLLFVIFMFALTWTSTRAKASSPDDRQIRRDCRADALKHCRPAIYSLDRGTIIACMVANKDKLSAACARHLW